MATWTRPKGTKYGMDRETVRCDDCSNFDAQGFALSRPNDPDGERCWAPNKMTAMPGRLTCHECGRDIWAA